jgi:hypothetical protein
MFNLKGYIAEAANDTTRLKHLSHLEDLIFEEGKQGLQFAIDSIQIYVNALYNKSSGATITTKWDGSPSIIVHQSGNDYWVASKSAFNATPKLNRTDSDIEANHGHSAGLVEKLKYALKYCKDLGINGTLQGDFLYTDGDLKPQTIDGVKHVTFKPNTITYAVAVDSDLGRRILASKMGIIFHTYYTGNDFTTMKANFGYSVEKLKKSRNVFVDDAILKDKTKDLTLTQAEQETILNAHAELKKLNMAIPTSFLSWLSTHKIVSALIAKYNNANVRAGSYVGSSKAHGVSQFIHDELQKEIDKVKTTTTKTKKENERQQILDFVDSHKMVLEKVYEAFSLVVACKMIIVSKLNRLETGVSGFVEKGNALVPTAPEGFVAVQGDRVVKLVDRLEFSRNNFLRQR